MTRAGWYFRIHGGGLRKARKAFVCQQALCLARIEAGTKYFDTCQVTTWPATKRICTKCAGEELK